MLIGNLIDPSHKPIDHQYQDRRDRCTTIKANADTKPMPAQVHNPAAVVNPLTWLFSCDHDRSNPKKTNTADNLSRQSCNI